MRSSRCLFQRMKNLEGIKQSRSARQHHTSSTIPLPHTFLRCSLNPRSQPFHHYLKPLFHRLSSFEPVPNITRRHGGDQVPVPGPNWVVRKTGACHGGTPADRITDCLRVRREYRRSPWSAGSITSSNCTSGFRFSRMIDSN